MKLKLNKSVQFASTKSNGKPNDDEIKQIGEYTLVDVTEENIYVRTMYLAHNAIDRDDDVFDDGLLNDFARTLPGKGLFDKHPMSYDGDTGYGEGRFFAASVKDLSLDEARELLKQAQLKFPPSTERAKILEAKFYIPRTEQNASLIESIDFGIANDVSIGFRASDRSPITSGESDTVIASRLLGPGEALEGSLVWLGAQPGARVVKQATLFDTPEFETEDEKMDLEELKQQLKTAKDNHKTEVDGLKVKLTAAEKLGDNFKALQTKLGDDFKALLDTPDALLDAIKNGQAYRNDLVENVIKCERLCGFLSDDSEEGLKVVKEQYSELPDDRLQQQLKFAQDRLPKNLTQAQLDSGDMNATGANEQDRVDGEKDASDVASNPLVSYGAQT